MYEAPYLRPVTDVRSVSAAVAIAVAQAADHHGLAEEPLTDPKIYGPHANEELVGEALAPASGPAVIAQGSAGDIDPVERKPRGQVTSRPEVIKQVVDGSLQRLCVDVIHLLPAPGRPRGAHRGRSSVLPLPWGPMTPAVRSHSSHREVDGPHVLQAPGRVAPHRSVHELDEKRPASLAKCADRRPV